MGEAQGIIVIQLPMGAGLGTPDQIRTRERLAEAFDLHFPGHDGRGFFDGIDYGSNAAVLRVVEIDELHWNTALSRISSELSRLDLLDEAVVVREIQLEDEPWVEYRVIWPEDFHGKFKWSERRPPIQAQDA